MNLRVHQVPVCDNREFRVSKSEIARRMAAFDRLSVSIVVVTAVFAIDLILTNVLVSILLILALALVLLVSHIALASGFKRFTKTSWMVSDNILLRSDEQSNEEFALGSVESVRTKRTTAGGIREIKINLKGGRIVYINGLENFEAFRTALLSGTPHIKEEDLLREVIDFDHPLFYVFFGAIVGLSITLAIRIAMSASSSVGNYVYVALAVYSLALGAYWLRAKPLSVRYGKRSVLLDYVFGFGIICVGAIAAIAAFLA